MTQPPTPEDDLGRDIYGDFHPFVRELLKEIGREELKDGKYDSPEAMVELGEQLQEALEDVHTEEQLELLAQATREDRSVEDIIEEKQESGMPVDEATEKVVEFREAREQFSNRFFGDDHDDDEEGEDDDGLVDA